MFLDSQLILDSNTSLALVAGSYPSANVIDFLGMGVGTAPANYFGVQNTVWGEDIGIGDGASPPNILCVVGTAFAGGTSVNVQLQESVDSGPTGAPPYSPNAWTTIAETGVLLDAVLTAGQKIAEFTIPPRAPGQAFPRFFRLQYVTAGTHTAGTIAFAGILTGRDDAPIYPSAF